MQLSILLITRDQTELSWYPEVALAYKYKDMDNERERQNLQTTFQYAAWKS